MSKRDGYQPGIPCWIDTRQHDPHKTAMFYEQLFGWRTEEQMPAGSAGSFLLCKLRGRTVAAIRSQLPAIASHVPTWDTYMWVESVDEFAMKVTRAGGSIMKEPLDLLDVGRIGLFSDPFGALFGVWQAKKLKGAQLVNETGAWNWSELNTRDLQGSKAFYSNTFGWRTGTIDLEEVEYPLWRVPGYDAIEGPKEFRDLVGGMKLMTSSQYSADLSPHWGIGFAVENADSTAGLTEKLGGKIRVPPYDTPFGRSAVLSDPQGTVFNINKLNSP